ncbi:MAG: sensor histidine kinase [Nannocystales bacterium]
MIAPLPPNEQERLQSLRALAILDTPPEERFDRITRLAAQIIGTPIVLISLVDEARQWFKSAVGLDAPQTPRDVAFCAHAILDTKVFVIPDAHEDPRFATNPLVTGAPHVRFYAGAPLSLSDGVRIGTLCAIDTESRSLSEHERSALVDLAQIVVDELHLRKHVVDLQRTREALETTTAELRLANESLEQFAHLASHDLRAPLKTIVNLAELALEDADENDDSSELSLIRKTAGELEGVVSGYRRLSRLQLSVSEPHKLSVLVEAARTQVSPDYALELRGDAELWCDPDLIRSTFVNLFRNAAQYGAGDVTVDIQGQGRRANIRVSNSIAARVEVDQSVFVPFRRLTSSGDGTGLGLAIVDRVVKLHGGTATASGSDTSFSIELSLPVGGPTS